jgi:hypothetical protein
MHGALSKGKHSGPTMSMPHKTFQAQVPSKGDSGRRTELRECSAINHKENQRCQNTHGADGGLAPVEKNGCFFA